MDIFTELDEEDGIVQISFAAITQDGDGIKKADIVARLRMKKELGWALCRALNKLDAGLARPCRRQASMNGAGIQRHP